MAFCISGSLLRAIFNIVFFSCLILLLFVANKFLILLLLETVYHQATEFFLWLLFPWSGIHCSKSSQPSCISRPIWEAETLQKW